MKNFFLIAVLLIASVCYFGLHNSSDVSVNEPDKVLRVGVECDYPPNNWEEDHSTNSNVPLVNKNGFFADGYDIQIAKIAARSLGAKLEVKEIAWEDLIPALNRNEIDAIFSGMLDTNERKKIISFTESYEARVTEYAVVIQKSGKWTDAKKLTDFEGARFVAQVDSNLDSAIDQLTGAIHLPPVNATAEMLEALLNNKADGIVTDFGIAETYAKEHSNLKVVAFPKGESFVFDHTSVCAGVRKTDVELLKDLNKVFENLSAEERQKIMDGALAKHMNDANF